jgi:hypothetical protein
MSIREDAMIEAYWKTIGGTLVKDDSVLRPMLEVFPNMKVQVIEEF